MKSSPDPRRPGSFHQASDFVPFSFGASEAPRDSPPGDASDANDADPVGRWLDNMPFDSADVERAMSNRPARSEEAAATLEPDSGWRLPDFGRGARGDAVDEAYRRGHREGTEAGRRLSEEHVTRAATVLMGAAEHVRAADQEFAHHRERDLQALAIAVARMLVQRELAADPALVMDLTRRALDLVPAETSLELRLHPDDLLLARRASEMAGSTDGPIRWVADPTIEPGAFVIETPRHVVDGRPDTALRELYERLGHE